MRDSSRRSIRLRLPFRTANLKFSSPSKALRQRCTKEVSITRDKRERGVFVREGLG